MSKILDEIQQLLPSVGVAFPNFPAADQIMREADEHAIEAEDWYRRGLVAVEAGSPNSYAFHRAQIEMAAVGLCQQRAILLVLSELIGATIVNEPGRQVS